MSSSPRRLNWPYGEAASTKAVDKDGRTPLHNATRAGSKDAIREPIEKGADIKAADKDGRSPLHEAARAGSRNAIRGRIMRGTDVTVVNKDGRSPLHDAARAGSSNSIRELIIKGADIKAVDDDGRSPLHDAAQAGSENSIWELIRSGADVKAVDKDGRTPLHDAVRADSEYSIRYLILRGADIKAVDKDGRTPLHDAVRAGSKDSIEELILRGADIKAVDKDGRTPLYDAARAGSRDTILQTLSATPRDFVGDFVECNGNIFWEGMMTYKKCEGVFSDILTISRLNTQGHCYMARSVSEFLHEYYQAFGLEILNWITRICKQSQELDENTAVEGTIDARSHLSRSKLYEIHQGSIESTAASRPISTEATDFPSVQDIIVNGTTYAIIKGHLEAAQLTWAISTTSKELAIEVKSALTWTLSVLHNQPPDAEGLFSWTPVPLDIGLPEITRFEPTRTESYCWTNLFSYACIAYLPSLHFRYQSAKEGLEIDFNLLLELAAVDRKIATEDGFILFGFDTALIPLEPPGSRRWHFLVTNGRQITPARVKREFGGVRFRGEIGPDYLTGNVYVGWCAAPVVKIGTIGSDKVPVDDISMSSGVPNIKKLEETTERSSGNDVSFFSRIGFVGSSVGVSGGTKREKKFKQIAVVTNRTQKDNFEGVLASARATPCILWDQSAQRAWLVSAVSALLFASLRYVKWKEYSFKNRQADGQFGPATVHYASQSTNTTREAESALRRSQMLLVDEANGVAVNDEISFEDIVMQIWFEMSVGDDVCFSDATGSKYEVKESLLGYDLNEAICGTRKYLRSLSVSGCMKSWQPLAHVKQAQVIFCKDIGAVLRCDSSTESDACCTRKYPVGALSCLVQDLRAFYGECWDTHLDPPTRISNLRGLPIGHDYEWIPSGCKSLYDQESRFCSRSLQSIVARKLQEKKLQKRKKKLQMKEGQNENVGTSLLLPPQDVPTMVTFGSGGGNVDGRP